MLKYLKKAASYAIAGVLLLSPVAHAKDPIRTIGRNPQTGESITIEARRVLTFKPSAVLRETIN